GRARTLEAMGRAEEALALFQQAIALFPEGENGAAAAAARHDLAHVLSDRKEIRYLLMAEKLYRRALESEARARVPRRYAETENSLAICLRRRAGFEVEAQRQATLEEVEALYRRAIRRLEGTGPIGLEALAQGHLNLGNFLCDEKEDLESGLREYDR